MKEQIEKEQKVLESLWEQSKNVRSQISKQRELLKTLHEKYNKSRTLSLKDIIKCDHLETTYNHFKKWCQENGFSNAGYFMDTNEYTIQVTFCVDDKKKLKTQKQNIQKYAKIASPREDGLVWMSVMENTLSLHGSYHICYDKEHGYKIHHTYRKFITEFMTKDELFEWGVKQIPYGGERDEY